MRAGARPPRASSPVVVDGKLEEAIDFRTMIHGIHAGQASNGGFREKGIMIYGFGGANDFSTVVFPGKLNNCTACHVGSSYQLAGIWAPPTANGILGTTTTTDAHHGAAMRGQPENLADRRGVLVVPRQRGGESSHAGSLQWREVLGYPGRSINANATTENCTFCHGAGRVLNVKAVHGIQ